MQKKYLEQIDKVYDEFNVAKMPRMVEEVLGSVKLENQAILKAPVQWFRSRPHQKSIWVCLVPIFLLGQCPTSPPRDLTDFPDSDNGHLLSFYRPRSSAGGLTRALLLREISQLFCLVLNQLLSSLGRWETSKCSSRLDMEYTTSLVCRRIKHRRTRNKGCKPGWCVTKPSGMDGGGAMGSMNSIGWMESKGKEMEKRHGVLVASAYTPRYIPFHWTVSSANQESNRFRIHILLSKTIRLDGPDRCFRLAASRHPEKAGRTKHIKHPRGGLGYGLSTSGELAAQLNRWPQSTC